MHVIYLFGEMDRQEAMKGKFSSSFYAIQIHSLPANMVLTKSFPSIRPPKEKFQALPGSPATRKVETWKQEAQSSFQFPGSVPT